MPGKAAKPSSARPGFAMAIILVHLGLSMAHGMAHTHLSITLAIAPKIFVGVVIVVAPLVAGFLIGKRRLRLGGALLAISMTGALGFGVYHHFLAPGPDNVNQSDSAGPARWRRLFRDTAVDLALIEALGALTGVMLFVKSSPQTAGKEASS